MATITKIYPHVNVSTKALLRRYVEPTESGATTLFAPFYSKKGPSNEIVKIYNLSQFTEVYGEPDFSTQGRTILNIVNWLTAGGAVYAMRLVSPDAERAKAEITNAVEDVIDKLTITSKYPGAFYNDLSIRLVGVSTTSTKYLNAEISLGSNIVQTVYKLTADNISDVLSSTEYISSFEFGDYGVEKTFDDLVDLIIESDGIIGEFEDGSDGLFSFEECLERFLGKISTGRNTVAESDTAIDSPGTSVTFTLNTPAVNWAIGDEITCSSPGGKEIIGTLKTKAINAGSEEQLDVTLDVISHTGEILNTESWTLELSNVRSSELYSNFIMNKLAVPFDVILDAGYSEDVKDGLKDLATDRDDVFLFLDMYDFSSHPSITRGELVDITVDNVNHALYAQRYLINEVISGKNIWVTTGYFLASLLPYNDSTYGLQWPTAGLTRGVLSGVKDIDENPNSDRKTDLFNAKINYSEKDSRGVRLMSQRTGEQEDTALQFINNVRTLNRMVRDLELLGREYLFEFNDATTLLNMENALKRYVTSWIQNRTLSLGDVQVSKNPYSDERVDVKLNIKFTGTIEIISIDITIE